ncbi:MAG: response regulator [Chloroflexi bacterium]|nr:response regulator [Chloroflexota bacterium]
MKKVLVVDDAVFMRMRCKKLLVENGFEVSEATTGAEAVALYQQSPFDVVLMDITMPEMDGIAAVRKLISIDPSVKVVMVTAMGQQAMVMEAIKAGAKDFVVKPFDSGRVLAAVNKLMN